MNGQDGLGRRDFIKVLGLAGAASALAGRASAAEPAAARMPQRVFGRSGIKVPILSIGGMFNIPNNQIVLHQALAQGVTYWDTADCYEGGKSETGMGEFFARVPGSREKVFLVTKSDARDPEGMTRLLNRSLERMQTDRIDLYFIHGISQISELNDETRTWAERAKKDGRIRLFGFSTHKNMQDCMLAAAGLGWIDGIMMKYDFRLMHDKRMKQAVAACGEAGIGLTAMKTQGGGPVRTESEADLALAGRFMKRGFTEKQAKLKAVWEDPSIASICSQMPNVTILKANVEAALDQTPLSGAERAGLQDYAAATAEGYCAGCGHICEAACGVPVCDVMRHLMYDRAYGETDLARRSFAALPAAVRAQLSTADFAVAERRCPQRLPVARLMREAASALA